MSGFGSFGTGFGDLSPEQEAASERWRLAGDPGTPEETLFQLASHPDPQVAMSIAGNVGASARVLRELCIHHPEVEPPARLNRNAEAAMKDASQLSQQSEDSLSVYLDERGATPDQRSRFIERYRSLRAPDGPTVWEAWESVRLGQQAAAAPVQGNQAH